MDDWQGIEQRIVEILHESPERFDPNTIANLHDLVSLARERCPPPKALAKGYWSTFIVAWDKVELEVFEDRIEVYPHSDGAMDIRYEAHSPRSTFSAEFIAELPMLS